MFWDIFRKKAFQPRTDVKCNHNQKCNLFKNTKFRRTDEIDCCICGFKQVALPSTLPLKEALANRLKGQAIGDYPFSKTNPPGASLRSCVPFYCKRCGNVICLECIQQWSLDGVCPECGTRLKHLTKAGRH